MRIRRRRAKVFSNPSADIPIPPLKHTPLGKREQFLIAVYSGAVARDLADNTTNAQLIAKAASEISEEKIPGIQ
jgi:hypothetical protein